MSRFATILCALGAIASASSISAQNLPGSEWAPVELNGEAFAPKAEIFLQFNQDGRYFGNGGCNTFRGSFVTNEAAILFSPAATTMMACPDEISRQEFDFLQALGSVRGFERDGLVMLLSDAKGNPVLKMQQRDAD